MCPLRSSEKQFLLEFARRALIAAVETRSVLESFDSIPNLPLSAGVFVTLRRKSRLRGCIGQIGLPQPTAPLVAYCAHAAALEDPRFQSVQLHEVPEIEIELSILSALEEIVSERIEIGKHGLMVTNGTIRGVLLPQVATQYRWNALRFLEETCAKAGLDRNAWSAAETRVEAFTAEVFSESELCAGAFAASQRSRGGTGYSSSM
ncbi:MAG: AmmeMemoRadiSam system protein A [Candidatus Acidiferrales bacterium]